jgi:hypothetical protein
MMVELEEYISKNKSAIENLFNAINEYSEELKKVGLPVYIQDGNSLEFSQQAFDEWSENNKEAISKRLEAEKKYIDETFALANLCGAVLQSAAVTIKKFSTKQAIPDKFKSALKSGSSVTSYFVGREIRGVHIGMVIYAGRNQYNHFEDGALLEPSLTAFNLLKRRELNIADESGSHVEGYDDPAFDLNNPNLSCYAHNLLALLGWKSYEDYKDDLLGMFLQKNFTQEIEDKVNECSFGTPPLWDAVVNKVTVDKKQLKKLIWMGANPENKNDLGNSVLSILKHRQPELHDFVVDRRVLYLKYLDHKGPKMQTNMRGYSL